MSGYSIAPAGADDLADLLPLLRGYCDFYETDPPDEDLLWLARTLIDDPEREGIQLLARDAAGSGAGFATVFWSYDTSTACRIGVMNDLYVAPAARGSGLADELIARCACLCRERGVPRLDWVTAADNLRAQAVYDRVGAKRESWQNYTLRVQPAGVRREDDLR
ncbi:MAG TPA: GNAT family N-acetyltransferase [Solirubrobacteraceae bacterium]|nr:GNAT family N-acetyltransferase [Solirubrobacteraceae bacterium]